MSSSAHCPIASCLGDTSVFKCNYTKELRLQANISDPVTYISEEPDTAPCLYRAISQLTNIGRWWSSGKPQQLRYAAAVPPSTLLSPARETTTTPPPSAASTTTQSYSDTSLATTVTPTATQSDSDSSALTTTSTSTRSSSDFSTTTTVNGEEIGGKRNLRGKCTRTRGGEPAKDRGFNRLPSSHQSKPRQKCVSTAHGKDTPLLFAMPGLTIYVKNDSYSSSSQRKGTEPHPSHLLCLNPPTLSLDFSPFHNLAHSFLSLESGIRARAGSGLLLFTSTSSWL
ncbi:hypothetical protein E2C01_055123 [Portunus trituberculatus]|uniref:Uncharacterized protein n=1 Tax=Portunus trituberculatus TaxID=210409 RepID=A0A5B7GLI1_PORTR|nr:hypothetical protein [Portunus trituberculatus]